MSRHGLVMLEPVPILNVARVGDRGVSGACLSSCNFERHFVLIESIFYWTKTVQMGPLIVMSFGSDRVPRMPSQEDVDLPSESDVVIGR